MHIGQRIHQILIEQERTPTWFARKICCSRQHVYVLFKKDNIDIELLKRICRILNHDFFEDISAEIQSRDM